MFWRTDFRNGIDVTNGILENSEDMRQCTLATNQKRGVLFPVDLGPQRYLRKCALDFVFTPCRDVHGECVCNMNDQCGERTKQKKKKNRSMRANELKGKRHQIIG